MEITAKTKTYFWLGALVALVGFVWMFNSILTPFVLGAIIAYLLNPLVKFFARESIPRWLSSGGILVLFILFLLVVLALVIPPLTREAIELAKALPDYIDRASQYLAPYVGWLQARLGDGGGEDLPTMIKENISSFASGAGGVIVGLKAGGAAAASAITTLVLTPLVAFFMMKDWPRITRWVNDLYPRQYETMIKDLLHQIDRKMAGFIRGQLLVAFFLGLGYAIALTIAGLNYGFLIGIVAGILSIIPLVGSTVGLLTSVIVAYIQTGGEWSYVAIIAGIFIVGQIIEGNILSPKLLGDNVGMHPLWILFALLAGGSLFGIVGMLIAVPVAAVVGVLVSFFVQQYKKSPLYQPRADDNQK
jgi:predicted PurR-regulated permease PerM